MWTFIVGLQNDCSKQKASFLQGVTGVEQNGQKKYRDLRERVKRAVGTYGQTEVLTIYICVLLHICGMPKITDYRLVVTDLCCCCLSFIFIISNNHHN